MLKKLAQTSGKNEKPDDSIHHDWQDYQRLLDKIGNENVTRAVRGRARLVDAAEGDTLAA